MSENIYRSQRNICGYLWNGKWESARVVVSCEREMQFPLSLIRRSFSAAVLFSYSFEQHIS